MLNFDKVKKELTAPIFNHINSLNEAQLIKQKTQLLKDMELIGTHEYFKGNCNDLFRIRNIELNYINYLLNS